MSKYKAVVTAAGAAKITAASAGGQQLSITHMAVGDGNGTLPTPTPTQTKLVNERSRARLNTLTVDKSIDNHIIAEIIIPANVGGFWLREMGLYDDTGTLIAVSNMAESYKPKLEEGSGRTQTLRMVLIVSSTEAIQLIAGGDTVMATRDFVDDAIKEHEKTRNHPDASTTAKGLVQLSSETTSANETKAATPKAVKDVNDASAKKSDNLSDLSDKTAARENLGLGSAATKEVGTDVAGQVLTVGNYGLSNTLKALTGVDLNTIQTFGFYVIQNPVNGPAGSSGGTLFLNVATWQSGTGTTGYRVVQEVIGYGQSGSTGNRVWRRTWTGSVWSVWVEFYSETHKPSADDVDAYNKSESNGRFAYKSITINGKPLSSNVNLTAGDVNAWNKTESDGRFIYKSGDTINWLNVNQGLVTGTDITVGRTLFVKGMEFIVKQGLQDPVNNYRQTNGMRIQGAGNLFVDIYHAERIGQHHFFGIHVANGGADGWYEFRNDGSFSAGSTVGAGGHQGSKLHTDGNIQGSLWGGYLSNHINTRSAISGGRNAWWYKDEVTGLIFQGGVVNRADHATWVGFPRGYARECFGVQMTLAWTNGSWFGDSRVNIQAREVGNGGFNAMMDQQEQSAFWWAVGV